MIEKGVPLFQGSENIVETFPYGTNNRIMLKRSSSMESCLINEVEKVLTDYIEQTGKYDGLIYMMFWKKDNKITPLYIGKSEKYGKSGGDLSINIKNIGQNKTNFCRWGYNYAYHIGDLSAVVCLGHPEIKILNKYSKLVALIFENYPVEEPVLKAPVCFWIKAWSKKDIGVWREFD